MGDVNSDFFEEDEPLDSLRAIFDASEKGTTQMPIPGGGHIVVPFTSFGVRESHTVQPGVLSVISSSVRTLA